MHGIVSLLDNDHYQMVEDVWRGLEETLGLRGIYTTPFPHYSYHVADHYDVDLVAPILHEVAAQIPPFEILTTGLGIFTEGLNPIIYVNVARSPIVSRVNAMLWPRLASASAGIVEYYHPDQWVPHITLSQGDLTEDRLADAIRVLGKWNFTWQITINNLALLFDAASGKQDSLHLRIPLSGKA